MPHGDPIDETGILQREGASFVLHRDAGGRRILELGRVPAEHVGKHVRIIGWLVDEEGVPGGIVEVEGVQAVRRASHE